MLGETLSEMKPEERLGAIIALLFLALALGIVIGLCVESVRHKGQVAELKRYHQNVSPRWFPESGFPVAGTAFRLLSLNHGKHWYATETSKDGDVIILGDAKEKLPAIYAQMEQESQLQRNKQMERLKRIRQAERRKQQEWLKPRQWERVFKSKFTDPTL